VKRGLVAAAGADAPVYEARLAQVRARVREAGAIAALIYGDVYRSDDIAHLTNLCIYWNEGVLAVPAAGPPAFIAKLSARVHPWMRRTSVLEDLRASQRLPELIASYLDELGPGPVAFIDEDWWPAELLAGIRTASDGREAVALPDAVRGQRLVPDAHDLDDLRRAGAIVADALAAAAAVDGGPDARIAALELSARGAGARDVLVGHRPVDGGGLALETTVQFANVWASAARTLGGDRTADAALADAVDGLTVGATAANLIAAAGDHAGVAVVHHCDLGTAGDYRPRTDARLGLDDGAVVAVIARSGDTVAGGTYLVGADGATPLTGATVEASA
jgi:hypothetical protein